MRVASTEPYNILNPKEMTDPMKTPVIFAPSKSEIAVDLIDLPPLQPTQVLVETEFSAISPGTELAWLHNLPNTPGKYPYYPGYSASGRVLEIGLAVDHLSAGQRVVCRSRHAARSVVEAASCLPIPEGLADEAASVYSLGSIVLQGVRKAQIQLGWDVAVIGLGPIGNLAGQIVRAAGATHVEGIDPVAWRRDLALQSGFDAVAASTEATSLPEYDAVIEAAGVPQTIPPAFQLARQMGHVVLLASTRGETENVNFYRDVHRKGLTVIGAHAMNRAKADNHLHFTTLQADDVTTLKLMAAGRVNVAPLISDIVSFEDAPQAYERLAGRDEELMLIVFRWK
jgi:2-desacetyl-2-hydroxyethyl bacteriochlorophyllide A dehydrogenase